MKQIVHFKREEVFRERAALVVAKHTERIKNGLQKASVIHVGSTAIEGSLTKGDVDLQVRIPIEEFDHAKSFLLKHYTINTGSTQTSFFCAFEDEEDLLPLGLQLTAEGSELDHFWKVKAYFVAYPCEVIQYNELKLMFEGKDMETYRHAKSLYMRRILTSKEYREFEKRLGER
ncbi:GrpB family protein [Alkalihalophilus marmarensis]|uniref:GrpB family protein n=1 Tax=Alkalihalophilus marmarensis TaxID=521377 RepID=UPI002DBA4874|nr:GrpB family protein [Alkalihalophilus marmarensis]MEC2073383.1 GrpB family protein [Alkalihalophilus marmarensis]